MHQQYETPSRQLADRGTLIYSDEQLPLSQTEWEMLKQLVEAADYHHVVGGDASEKHSVYVARFVNDVDKPRALSPLTGAIQQIVMSDKMRDFYSRFAGTSELCLRRCQANRLENGDYIGVHKDQDSNPDYLATVVFHFDAEYEGGEFITYHEDGQARFHPQPRSMLVNNCEIPHEVSRVNTGKRQTLACFLSREFGDSPAHRQDFELSN